MGLKGEPVSTKQNRSDPGCNTKEKLENESGE